MRYFIWFFSKSSPNFSKLFISPKKNLIYLTIFILCSFSCSQVSVSEISENKHSGDIYGKIDISGPSFSLKGVTVFIQGKSKSTKTDSTGYFFIPGISPEKYSVIARNNGFADCTINLVEVSADSITLLAQHILYKSASEELWNGIKIKRVDTKSRGNIKGSVVDAQANKDVDNVVVFIKGTPWSAYTDSSGTFEIENILCGIYNVKTSKLGFHQTKILNVHIKSGQSSLVDFRLINIGIPENPLPYKWEPHYLNK
ncbi:MAG: carboxypeptidase regulatory-like domain-containing protein [Bacteroidetes bacterium]|nr:carboxypeptidase regulatory-like domain-containing protein [Bacteroidota bacterium]